MKRLRLLPLCLIVLSLRMFANGSVGFGLQATGAEVNFEDKTVKELYGRGFGGGAHLDINFVPAVAIRLSGDYIVFSPDNDKFKTLLAREQAGSVPADFNIDGGQINFLTFAANLKAGLPAPVFSPYLTGGVGTTTIGTSDLKVSYRGGAQEKFEGVKSETKFSANAGGGVDLKIGITLYIEARYTWIFSEGNTSTYIPVSIGVTF